MPKKPARILWMDVFRGLLILSVVIGHTTGKFNAYIYQFHMGAFFLASGFTTKQESRSLLETIYHRFLTLWLPLFTSIVLVQMVVECLNASGNYEVFLTSPYMPLPDVLKQFLTNGAIYTWWLGAAWFLLVLFAITLLHRVLFQLFGQHYGILYAVVSIGLFLVGYSMAQSGTTKWNLDLVLIAQLYFAIGLYLQKYQGKFAQNNKPGVMFTVAIITFFFMWANATQFHCTMDFPSRAFNSPAVDFLLVLNGTIFIYAVSRLVGYIPYLSTWIRYLGRNTLPILLFHFMAYKAAYALLAAAGYMRWEQIAELTPPVEIGMRFWWLIAAVAIIICQIIWKGIRCVKLLRIAFGQEKTLYDACYEKLKKYGWWKRLEKEIGRIELPQIEISKEERIALVKKYHPYMLMFGLILLLVMIPIVKQGIILNDEVQMYQTRLQGWFTLLFRNIGEEIRMGRPLRILAALNAALSFITKNIYLNRIIQCGCIFAGFSSFGYFTYKLLNNKRFSIFVTMFIMLFFPITFERTAPNAFNGLVFIPMTELFLSLTLYCNYLDTHKKQTLYYAVGLFIPALLGYEFMITFIPLYGLTYMYKSYIQNQFEIKKALRAVGVCGMIGIVFVAMLLITSKLCQGEYDGAQFGFVSVESSFSIIWMLFISALPGYWITNDKYQYLFSIFQQNSCVTLRNILLISIVFIALLTLIKTRKPIACKTTQKQVLIHFAVLAAGTVYCFFPATANAVSKIYQGNVTSEHFTALPVSPFLYLFTCFSICYFVWVILQKMKNRNLIALVCATVITLSAFPVQCMNSVLAQEQHRNTERFVKMNALFETNTLKKLTNNTVYAPELYETQNALAIHRGYFESVAEQNGIKNIAIISESEENCNVMLFETGLNQWTVTTGDEAVILSEYRLDGEVGVRLSSALSEFVEVSEQGRDGDFYYYHFKKDDAGSLKVSNDEPFTSILKTAGTTLETANIEYGVHSDGWVEPEAKIQIATGDEGIILLKGYYNQGITGDDIIYVYQGEKLLSKYVISGHNVEFEIPYMPNSTADLTIKCNFFFEANPPDIRKLSFILDELSGDEGDE